MTNPQIATRLFLSHRTVATHVSHILGKLDVRSRIDIAREATLGGRWQASPEARPSEFNGLEHHPYPEATHSRSVRHGVGLPRRRRRSDDGQRILKPA